MTSVAFPASHHGRLGPTTTTPPRELAPRSQGFILVATLWVLAALTLLANYINGVTTARVERATAARLALQGELDRRNTETTLVYLLATNRANHRAAVLAEEQRFGDFGEINDPELPIREIVLDGRVYRGLGDTRFSIQDEAGLVPVNSPANPALAAALRHVGVSTLDTRRIVDRVNDYVDVDGEPALNGAERFEYVRRDLPPPPNWLMASPLELKKVLGVEDLITADQWRRLYPMLTMRQAIGLNFHTMHPELMRALLRDDFAVRRILDARAEDAPVNGIADAALDIDDAELRIMVSNRLRISTSYGEGVRQLAGIALTPTADGAPWRQDYRYTEPSFNAEGIPGTAPERPATPLLQ